jgi:N-acetylmuramic acid 6-phosphate etherase
MNADQCVVGVDGGGTKTVAWLAVRSPTGSEDILGRGRSGPANPSAVGIGSAISSIQEAIESAFADAGMQQRQPLAAACLAIAGADRDAESSQIAAWAERQSLAARLWFSNDAEPLLACIDLGWGVALIAGTGSFALGRTADGQIAKVGGWGFRLGDEGSGYAVAIEGLTAAAKFADGRGPETTLLDAVMSRFSVREPRDLISRLYDPEVDRRAIADLAPLVLAHSQANDPVARAVVSRAAKSLAVLVGTVRCQLSLPPDSPIAMTGGLLVNSSEVRASLIAALRRDGLTSEPTLVPEPVRGAVELARRL